MLLDSKYFEGTDMISSTAWVKGGTSPCVGDIIEQIDSTSFIVKTVEGKSDCTLVKRVRNPGEMSITATHNQRGAFNIVEILPETVLHPDGTTYNWVTGARNAFGDTVGLVSL